MVDPTPEQIRQRAAAIRASWTEEERQRRALDPAKAAETDERDAELLAGGQRRRRAS